MTTRRRAGVLVAALGLALLFGADRALAQDATIAYEVPAGTVGNQANFGGALGMFFQVELDLVVTRLGVFDSGGDGIAGALEARLYDVDTFEVVATMGFDAGDPGELVEGSRFKDIDEVELPAGFRGAIVADGFGASDPNGNAGIVGLTTNDGGCAIAFVGGGAWGDPGTLPANADGGPANRYAAGTFEFVPLETPTPRDAIAFQVAEGTVGNQAFGGSLGMDFRVNEYIDVVRLGVFDSGADGLLLPISARIYDLDSLSELARLEFTPEDPGELLGGHRFKELDPPLVLAPDTRATIVTAGYGELEMNGNQGAEDLGVVSDNGGCAIAFIGGGRFGNDPAAFPASPDFGRTDRYVAGTFEFELGEAPADPPPLPPTMLRAVAGDRRVDLSWTAPAGEVAAASYRVLRSTAGGAPTEIARDVTATTFADASVANGVPVCYVVRAVSATGQVSGESTQRCAVPSAGLGTGETVAYVVPGGTAGNQEFGGVLGMDFDVAYDVEVQTLGVFDDLSDGLTRTIQARLYDRDTLEVLAQLEFTPASPGALEGGSRFKPLDEPLELAAGFRGTIAAEGYGAGERNGNLGPGPLDISTDDGECRLQFVGSGRFGTTAGGYPDTPDAGPANRYAAGTFTFEALDETIELPLVAPTGVSAVSGDGNEITVDWSSTEGVRCIEPAARYRVYRRVGAGPIAAVATVDSPPFTDSGVAEGSAACYTVRSVAADDRESPDSTEVCAVAGRVIAYVVPAGTIGAEIFPSAAGMDFNVTLDIAVTRLGVFDSGNDGLVNPLTAHIYDRISGEEITSLTFFPEDAGESINGSIFLELDEPLELSAGFRGSIVVDGFSDLDPYGTGGAWYTDRGPCSVSYVGRGRRGDEGFFPTEVVFGRADQFAAGTFEFVALEMGSPRDAIAYVVPEGTIGNQFFTGPLGHDFDAVVDIDIVRVGVFDSGGDGIASPLQVRLYDRDTLEVLSTTDFTSDDPGDLDGGSRFKDVEPISLAAGFRGSIVASGFNDIDANGNEGAAELGLERDDGLCAIDFVGGGRFGEPTAPESFPGTVDGGPPNRYAAATFEFEVSGGVSGPRFVRGDSNSDGVINLTDGVVTLTFLFAGGAAPACFDAADADDSGGNALTLTDAVFTFNWLFTGGRIMPAPSPSATTYPAGDCGLDVTADGLGCARVAERCR